MDNELAGLPENVQLAFKKMDRDYPRGYEVYEEWQTIRAELLRLARENAELYRSGNRALAAIDRLNEILKSAESERDALRKRIDGAMTGIVDPTTDCAADRRLSLHGIDDDPYELAGKRVALVVLNGGEA